MWNRRRIACALAVSGLLGCGGGGSGSGPSAPPAPTGPFDLVFTGLALPHARQGLYVAVVRDGDGTVVATRSQVVAADGSFSFSWIDLLEGGQSYTLDFFADHNGNNTCDPPPTDHSWRESLGTVTAAVNYDFQHNANFTDVCLSFS